MADKNVWFVTGAGRGLGFDIAQSALAAEHSVVATGRDAARVENAVGAHENLEESEEYRTLTIIAGKQRIPSVYKEFSVSDTSDSTRCLTDFHGCFRGLTSP